MVQPAFCFSILGLKIPALTFVYFDYMPPNKRRIATHELSFLINHELMVMTVMANHDGHDSSIFFQKNGIAKLWKLRNCCETALKHVKLFRN
jgi:hypothetical protein